MKPNFLNRKATFFLIPYFLLFLIGAWYRYHISGLAFLDGDSEHYLTPPVFKALFGEWHKGERPMQYLLFIYYTLSDSVGIKYTIIVQQILGLIGGGLLATAWVVFISGLKGNKFLWHILGYMMLGIYISTPVLMIYEQFIGPESVCMFVMCAIICCLAFVDASILQRTFGMSALSACIFINLYLTNPMPKWIFVSIFLEVLLIYILVKTNSLSRKPKALAIILPHLLYFLLVFIPEFTNKIDTPNEGRVFIEYEQMVYTHFDLLAEDKTNFSLTPALDDSLIACFKIAQTVEPDFMIKFSSDNLMWGRANELIVQYFDNRVDSVEQYFIRLNWILATKYPLGLSREIGKQVFAFYFPNKYIHKYLYCSPHLSDSYESNMATLKHFDNYLFEHSKEYMMSPQYIAKMAPAKHITDYLLVPKYPPTVSAGNRYDPEFLPLPFRDRFFFYRYFDYIYILAMLAFAVLLIYEKKIFATNSISIFYIITFIYVLTVGIVHTFDIVRFTTTIYPFLLITTCMSLAYTGNFILNNLKDTLLKK